MASDQLSNALRRNKQSISDQFERALASHVPELRRLDRSARVDHLPEFLDGLAAWVEGETEEARVGFETLVTGHAIQRLGYGIELRTLTREYALLRTVLLRHAAPHAAADGADDSLRRLNEGLDEAIYEAVHRYTESRELTRDRFVAILAHDLRNPLNAITMGAEYLAVASTEEIVQRSSRAITRAAQRMGRMIADVLEFARGQLGGGIPVALERCDLGQICEEVVAEIRTAHPGPNITTSLRGDLHGAFDHDRVCQAISNLVSNAIQHGQDPIVLSVAEADDGRALESRVTSRGDAIPAQALPTLFDPLRSHSLNRLDRLGLGLFIVKQIALAHGARCTVTSTVDAATTFTIHWPRVRSDEGTDYR